MFYASIGGGDPVPCKQGHGHGGEAADHHQDVETHIPQGLLQISCHSARKQHGQGHEAGAKGIVGRFERAGREVHHIHRIGCKAVTVAELVEDDAGADGPDGFRLREGQEQVHGAGQGEAEGHGQQAGAQAPAGDVPAAQDAARHGQILLSTDDNFIYLDNGNQRIQYRNNGTSSGVTYINTTSGLSADDVQDAIDELAERTQVATSSRLGIVKPDGDTITIDSNGVLTGNRGSADSITYSNTVSELESTNVQDAIDELKSLINTLQTAIGNLNNTVSQKLDKSALTVSGTDLNIQLNLSE